MPKAIRQPPTAATKAVTKYGASPADVVEARLRAYHTNNGPTESRLLAQELTGAPVAAWFVSVCGITSFHRGGG
jgi:hypothetical protein